MGALAYFIQGVRMSGFVAFVGSSLVGFFSLLIFLTFMSQFYASLKLLGVSVYRGGDSKRKGRLSWEAARSQSRDFFGLPYRGFPSGLVDSSFLDFFKVFFAMSLFSLSSCPSGAMPCILQSSCQSPGDSSHPISLVECV
jgi:hypothetical protein